MFKTKFSSLNDKFGSEFKQSNTSVDTNFDGYEVLKGEDGFSPIIDIQEKENGYSIVITDKENVESFDITNGKDGRDGKDGQDGYTPIKGVDYFDGTDGAPGKNGVNGKDGYTPVKGKDYFDGAPGKDGQPGKDGKDGYTPIKGIDYFTEADKDELVEDVIASIEIPDTEPPSWDEITDKPDIPSIDGLATEKYVDNAIANIGPVAGLWEQVEGESGIRVKGAGGSASGKLAITNGDDKTSSAGVKYKSIASGDRAVSFGYGNTCSGRATLAQGLYNTVSKNDSAAIGQKNVVDGAQSFAAGMDNQITAMYSNAFGYMNKVTATNGLAAGYKNTASGTGAVALGDTCEAQGTSAIALGYKTISGGYATATMGANTKATNRGEVAMGEFNESNTSEDPAQQTSFSFGVGTSDTERANAFEIKKNGDIYFGGTKFESENFATKAYVEALIGEVENGTYG